MWVESGKRAHPVKGVEVLRKVVIFVHHAAAQHLEGHGGAARLQEHLRGGVVEVHHARRVSHRSDPMADTLRLDDERLARAEGIRYADDGLKRVALCTAGRRTVRRLVADADVVVEDLAHDLSRHAWAIVGDTQAYEVIFALDLDAHDRRDARRLAGV